MRLSDEQLEQVLEEISTEALAACRAAESHLAELREAFRSGALSSNDGKNGLRSNRNADVHLQLLKLLVKIDHMKQPKITDDPLEVCRMVVNYFGDEEINPLLDGDIKLRDSALSALAKAGSVEPEEAEAPEQAKVFAETEKVAAGDTRRQG